jgi:hypothetical protein
MLGLYSFEHCDGPQLLDELAKILIRRKILAFVQEITQRATPLQAGRPENQTSESSDFLSSPHVPVRLTLEHMSGNEVLASIDAEINALKQARALLIGADTATLKKKKSSKKPLKKKRTLSPEAKARIAEGQRKRWAAQKKSRK